MMRRTEKSLKPWHMGTHLTVLSESYLMNTNMTGLRWFSDFLEVVVQQPLFSSLLLSYIPGGGPGSWLMHFPYVVLHGCFGKF